MPSGSRPLIGSSKSSVAGSPSSAAAMPEPLRHAEREPADAPAGDVRQADLVEHLVDAACAAGRRRRRASAGAGAPCACRAACGRRAARRPRASARRARGSAGRRWSRCRRSGGRARGSSASSSTCRRRWGRGSRSRRRAGCRTSDRRRRRRRRSAWSARAPRSSRALLRFGASRCLPSWSRRDADDDHDQQDHARRIQFLTCRTVPSHDGRSGNEIDGKPTSGSARQARHDVDDRIADHDERRRRPWRRRMVRFCPGRRSCIDHRRGGRPAHRARGWTSPATSG